MMPKKISDYYKIWHFFNHFPFLGINKKYTKIKVPIIIVLFYTLLIPKIFTDIPLKNLTL